MDSDDQMNKLDLRDARTMSDTTDKVYDIIKRLCLPPSMTIGIYFRDHFGYIKRTAKSGYTLLVRVRFENPTSYPCVIDMRKFRDGVEEDDDYAIVDMTDKEDVSRIYGMDIPSEDELALFQMKLFPAQFDVRTEELRDVLEDGQTSHLSKSVSTAKLYLSDMEDMKIKIYKGRVLVKNEVAPVQNVTILKGSKMAATTSAGLLGSVLGGDVSRIFLHTGMLVVENQFEGQLLNFSFIIYQTEI